MCLAVKSLYLSSTITCSIRQVNVTFPMKTTRNVLSSSVTPSKKAYKTPRLKALGSVKKLTLKIGSNTDMQGGFQ